MALPVLTHDQQPVFATRPFSLSPVWTETAPFSSLLQDTKADISPLLIPNNFGRRAFADSQSHPFPFKVLFSWAGFF
jgi:hypothetical protein